MLNVPSVWFLLNMVYSEAALILLAHNLSDYKTDGEGNGNLLQYSCLENPMDRGALLAIVRGVAKESDTIYQLNINTNGCYT